MNKNTHIQLLIICTVILCLNAQRPRPHARIGKNTWATSNPTKCMDFILKYVPQTVTSSDSCPNSKCECATQGRTQIQLVANAGGLPRNTFGMHHINCTYHPYGDIPLSETEKSIQNELGDFSEYNHFMEYGTGLWTNDLDSIIQALDDGNENYFPTKFSYEGKEYYSVLVNVCGYVNIEFIGDNQTKIPSNLFTEMEDRMIFKDTRDILENDFVTPLKVMRATASLDKVNTYYTEILGAEILYQNTQSDGTRVSVIQLPQASTHVHFVQPPSDLDATYTVKDFEDYANSVHDQYIKSNICGIDQYFDNHLGYTNQKIELTSIAKKLEAAGYKYRWFGGLNNIYALDPTGFSIQMNGDSTGHPSNLPTYGAACKSNDGCAGQGICNNDFLGWVTQFQ